MELEIDVFVSIIGGYGRSVNIVKFRGVGSTSAGSGLRILERYREGAEIPLLETVFAEMPQSFPSNRQATLARPVRLLPDCLEIFKASSEGFDPSEDRSYFLATRMTARIMSPIPASYQVPKRRWKRKKEKMTDETGSMAPMMLVSAGWI